MNAAITRVPTIFGWVSEIVRYSSQFSLCSACFLWSGAENTGCNQQITFATSTCRGEDCPVKYGDPLKSGDGSCYETAWQASSFVGEADVYPAYSDHKKGWDLSAENSGKEWIEVKFADAVYVSAFELYETYKPGALFKVSSTQDYVDDNTVACCGDAPR